MKFVEAMDMCRHGRRIHRTGWNSKEQFVFYQPGSVIPFSRLRVDALREYLVKKAGKPTPFNMNDVVIAGHLDIFTEQRVVQCGWLASQEDTQAEDWEVLE